jgi:hypothetical protein
VNGWAFVDAALFGVIAWGIYWMSRVAAIAGLGLYILEQVASVATTDSKHGFGAITIIIILAFVNSVRGTFAYHRLRKAETEI